MSQIPIKGLELKNVTTRFGEKIIYKIDVDSPDSPNGVFSFECWQGNWNKDWMQGTQIDVPSSSDSRWKKREFKGNSIFTLSAPAESRQKYSQSDSPQTTSPQATTSPTVSNEQLEDIIVKIDKILSELAKISVSIMGLNIDKDIDIPIISNKDDDIKIEDIPF